jgi:CRP-like cAMP-binding protein
MKPPVHNRNLKNLPGNHCTSCDLESCFIVRNFTDKNCLDTISANKNCLTFQVLSRVISEHLHEEGIYILNRGKLKLYKTGRQGQEIIIRFIKPGEVFSFFQNGDNDETSFNVRALEESSVCFLSKEALMSINCKYPEMGDHLSQAFYKTLNDLQDRYYKATQYHVPAKVADALVMIYDAFGQDQSGALNVKLSREDIAGLATTTKEQVSKVFSELKAAGIIKSKGKKIEIMKLEELKIAANKE